MVDPGGALELEPGHVLGVADRPDHGQLIAIDDVSARADAVHPLDDGLDLLFGGRRFHHDHHLLVLSQRLETVRKLERSARRGLAAPDLRICAR